MLTGAIELHQLVLLDPVQLERRREEITAEIINATCSMTIDDGTMVPWYHNEVKRAPLPNPSSGDATVVRLLLQSLGLSASAAEQGRRSQQGGQSRKWIYENPPVVCSWKWLH